MEIHEHVTEDQRQAVEAFRQRHRTAVLTLLFSDVVGSTDLKSRLDDATGSQLIHEHRVLVRQILAQYKEAEEIGTWGDAFFIVFLRPSDGTSFALRLQNALRVQGSRAGSGRVQARIGIHMGEVFLDEGAGGSPKRDVLGLQVDKAARVMSLAAGGQILVTHGVFDNARMILKGDAPSGLAPLAWLSHGYYVLKGLDEPEEIFEAGEQSAAPLLAPPDGEKGRRCFAADREPVTGWRPAVEQAVPGTDWVLEQKIGQGSFGEVWVGLSKALQERRVFKFCFLAERVRSLKREVALFRILKQRLGEHPHLVRVFDVHFEKPPYYLAMEHVEGKDLAKWCRENGGASAIPLETRLAIVAQAADGLQAAHAAGVIHRDIKPSNILVCGQGVGPNDVRVKITDFGIGRAIAEKAVSGATTGGGTEIRSAADPFSGGGSRLYMAPEVMAGRGSTPQSDIYSLGVVLFQLLVGDLTCPLTTDWQNKIRDRFLAGALILCFAGDPGARYSEARQLAERLRSQEAGHAAQSTAAGRPPVAPLLRKRPKVFLTMAVLLCFVVGIWSLFFWLRGGSGPNGAGGASPTRKKFDAAVAVSPMPPSGSPTPQPPNPPGPPADAAPMVFSVPPPDLKPWQGEIERLRNYLNEMTPVVGSWDSPIAANAIPNDTRFFLLRSSLAVCENGLRNLENGKYHSARSCFSQARSFVGGGPALVLDELKAQGKTSFAAQALRECLDRLSTVGAPDPKDLIAVYITVTRGDGTFMGVNGSTFADQVIEHAERAFLDAEIPVKRWPHKPGSRLTCEIAYTLGQRGDYSNLPMVAVPQPGSSRREGLVCTAQYQVKITDNSTGRVVLEFEDSGEYHHSSQGIHLTSSREDLARRVFSPAGFKFEEHFATLRARQ